MRLFNLEEAPQFREAVLSLVEEDFPSGSHTEGHSNLETEFQLLLNKNNAKRNYFIVDDNDNVISTASYRLFNVDIPEKPGLILKCAGVGLVVTRQSARGQGLATKIQERIEKEASQEGALLSVLWSDKTQFYMNRGYLIAGSELTWLLEKEDVEILQKRLYAETKKGEWEVRALTNLDAAQALYEGLHVGPERDFQEYKNFLKLPKTWAFGAWKNNQLEAYACLGKARDLRDTVHELVGNPRALPCLLAEIAPLLEKFLRVQQSVHTNLKEDLTYWLGESQKGPLAFMKCLNMEGFTKWFESNRCLPGDVHLPCRGDSFQIHKGREALFESDDSGHLIQLFMGPWEISEMEDLPSNLARALRAKRLPSLYFWGFDSV